MRKYIPFILLLIIVIGLSWFLLKKPGNPGLSPSNQIVTPSSDMVELDYPQPGTLITSPAVITGKAKGNWYFEATFPVQILDANGAILGRSPAQAQGEWMTTDFVPFIATVSFKTPTTATGFVVLKNDNPSGLPQNDRQVQYPVRFR